MNKASHFLHTDDNRFHNPCNIFSMISQLELSGSTGAYLWTRSYTLLYTWHLFLETLNIIFYWWSPFLNFWVEAKEIVRAAAWSCRLSQLQRWAKVANIKDIAFLLRYDLACPCLLTRHFIWSWPSFTNCLSNEFLLSMYFSIHYF